MAAAQRFELAEPTIARETCLAAVASALHTGGFSSTGTEEIAEAAPMGPSAPHPPRAGDLLLDALTVRVTKSYEDAVEPLRGALDTLRRSPRSQWSVRWLGLGCRLASDLWDDEMWFALTDLQLRRARRARPVRLGTRGAGEAAARKGRLDAASLDMERLSDRTSRIGSDWALGSDARCPSAMAVRRKTFTENRTFHDQDRACPSTASLRRMVTTPGPADRCPHTAACGAGVVRGHGR